MFDENWPSFLDCLDSDKNSAYKGFYQYAMSFFSICPPKVIRGQQELEREEFVAEVINHCINNNFRVLRKYENNGRAFRSWLITVAHNKCMDIIKKRSRNPITLERDNYIDENSQSEAIDLLNPNTEMRPHLKEAVDVVKELISMLGEKCKTLLELASQEYTAMEMSILMGWGNKANKKASDDLRECRKQLIKRLKDKGISVSDFFE